MNLSQEIKYLSAASVFAGLATVGSVWFLSELRTTADVGIGVFLSVMNIYFYTLVATALLLKKNIAWIGPVIVIKYLILIVSIYFIWRYCEVLPVLMGLFSELVLTAFFYWLIKIKLLKGKRHDTF